MRGGLPNSCQPTPTGILQKNLLAASHFAHIRGLWAVPDSWGMTLSISLYLALSPHFSFTTLSISSSLSISPSLSLSSDTDKPRDSKGLSPPHHQKPAQDQHGSAWSPEEITYPLPRVACGPGAPRLSQPVPVLAGHKEPWGPTRRGVS